MFRGWFTVLDALGSGLGEMQAATETIFKWFRKKHTYIHNVYT